MATTKFTVPNWAQALIARAVNLDPNEVAVRMEDDRNICFLEWKTRNEYTVNKVNGTFIVA